MKIFQDKNTPFLNIFLKIHFFKNPLRFGNSGVEFSQRSRLYHSPLTSGYRLRIKGIEASRFLWIFREHRMVKNFSLTYSCFSLKSTLDYSERMNVNLTIRTHIDCTLIRDKTKRLCRKEEAKKSQKYRTVGGVVRGKIIVGWCHGRR